MSTGRWVARAVATAVCLVTVAAPALASGSPNYWHATGSGSAYAKAKHINAPSLNLPVCTNGTGANASKVKIDLTWSAPSSGVAPAGYKVYFDSSTSTPGGTSSTTSYSTGFFTATASHTYSITVTSTKSSWESAASTSRTVSIKTNGNCNSVS